MSSKCATMFAGIMGICKLLMTLIDLVVKYFPQNKSWLTNVMVGSDREEIINWTLILN